MDDVFKFFKYKAKLLGDTETNEDNTILINTTTAVPLMYLSNFGDRSKCHWLISK